MQMKILRSIVKTRWYEGNAGIRAYLNIDSEEEDMHY